MLLSLLRPRSRRRRSRRRGIHLYLAAAAASFHGTADASVLMLASVIAAESVSFLPTRGARLRGQARQERRQRQGRAEEELPPLQRDPPAEMGVWDMELRYINVRLFIYRVFFFVSSIAFSTCSFFFSSFEAALLQCSYLMVDSCTTTCCYPPRPRPPPSLPPWLALGALAGALGALGSRGGEG